MEVANREFTKAINQFNILNTIRKAGLISRIEIAVLTGQSRAAVTNITARLIKEKMIIEKETEPPSGTALYGVIRLNPSEGDHVEAVVDHVENGLNHLSDFIGFGIIAAHARGNDLHADIPTIEFFRPQHLDASGPFNGVPLERKIDFLNPPALGKPAEFGLGALVPAAV